MSPEELESRVRFLTLVRQAVDELRSEQTSPSAVFELIVPEGEVKGRVHGFKLTMLKAVIEVDIDALPKHFSWNQLVKLLTGLLLEPYSNTPSYRRLEFQISLA